MKVAANKESPGRLIDAMLAFFVMVIAGTMVIGRGCASPRREMEPNAEGPRTASLDTSQVVPPGLVSDSTTLVEMQNVHYRIDPDLSLEIHRLSGEMVPQGRSYVYFDDPSGYVIRIRSAEVGMHPEALRLLLGRYVFNYDDAPVTIDEITIEDSLLVQKGTLHKLVGIPFEMKSVLSVTPDGLIRIRRRSMDTFGIPVKGVMKFLGLELDELIDLSGAEGVRAENNDLLLDAQRVLPPPAIRGRVTAVRLTKDEIVQTIEPNSAAAPMRPAPRPPAPEAENYMFFQGGTIRFGDLVLLGSELQLIDADPADPFDFFQDDYGPQLRAGYSRATASLGQMTFMPDYADVGTEVEPDEVLRANQP